MRLRLIAEEERLVLSGDARQLPEPCAAAASDRPEALRGRALEALAALAGLPERQRRLLTLKAAGFSYREIVVLDQSSYTAVNRHLARARAAIRGGEASC